MLSAGHGWVRQGCSPPVHPTLVASAWSGVLGIHWCHLVTGSARFPSCVTVNVGPASCNTFISSSASLLCLTHESPQSSYNYPGLTLIGARFRTLLLARRACKAGLGNTPPTGTLQNVVCICRAFLARPCVTTKKALSYAVIRGLAYLQNPEANCHNFTSHCSFRSCIHIVLHLTSTSGHACKFPNDGGVPCMCRTFAGRMKVVVQLSFSTPSFPTPTVLHMMHHSAYAFHISLHVWLACF